MLFSYDKFIISDKGEKAVFTRINDAWRCYKNFIKKRHFLMYSTLKDRLKHRPLSISEAYFRQLMEYWNTSTIKVRLFDVLYFTITFLSILIVIFCYYNVEYQREKCCKQGKTKIHSSHGIDQFFLEFMLNWYI